MIIFFSDEDFIRKLSTENRNIFQKIYDEIKYLCKVATAGSKEARELEKAKKLFEDMYRESEAKINTADEGGVNTKYSLSANAESELHKALYDKNYRNEVLLRDETPSIMLSQKGVKNHKMVMKVSHIRENVFTEEEARNMGLKIDDDIHYHGIGEENFLKIIDSLDNVKEAYRGTKYAKIPTRREKYFLLVSEFKDKNGNTINVPVYIEEGAICNRVYLTSNKIATVFGKDDFRGYINRQIREKNLVRIKNKNGEISEGGVPLTPAYENTVLNNSISNSTENVKLKDIDVHFADIDERGAYNPVFKEITLNKKLKLEKSKLTKTLIHEIQHAIQDIEGFAGGSNTEYWHDIGIPEDKLRDYYENTAGEIEARDAAMREWRTDEARKEKRPDIDRTDVVFADGGVSWTSAKKAKYDPEIASISEQIRNSQSVLNSMDIVGEATAPKTFKDKYEAGQWAITQLKAFGYQVDRQNFGKIYLGESDIKYGINYADTNAEKAALILIPKILKRGIEIGHHGNHKLRQKETITFAGPVILNGIRGNMAVVVNMRGNKYSVHRILLPDGSSFKFSEKNNEVKQESYQGVTVNSSLADTTSFTSNNSIPNSAETVKQNGKMSLSSKDTTPKKYGNYNVYGEDVMLEGKKKITAPIRENADSKKRDPKIDSAVPIRKDVKADLLSRSAESFGITKPGDYVQVQKRFLILSQVKTSLVTRANEAVQSPIEKALCRWKLIRRE